MKPAIEAFIGIGSNQGDAVANVCRAMAVLESNDSIDSIRCSSLYGSAPLGYLDQPDFVNAVCRVHTSLAPAELLQTMQQLERQSGRRHGGIRWGPRVLDLDLLLYGELQQASATLVIPHPRMHERAFVLYPLREIAPGLRIPGHGTVDELAAACADQACDRLQVAC